MADELGVGDVPSKALLWLDRDVAQYLHNVADLDYGGDVQAALNDNLRALMVAERSPGDPWALVEALAAARAGRRQVRRSEGP